MKRFLITALLLLPGIAGHGYAQSELRQYPLQHTTAEQLIPTLRPLIDEDAAISGHGNLLILRAERSALEQIEPLIRQLDQTQASLLISLRQGGGTVSDRRELAAAIQYDSDSDPNLSGQIRTSKRISTHGRRGEQSLRALDGGVIAISQGELIALPSAPLWGPGIVYEELQRGVVLRVRLAGKGVVLDVEARNDQRAGQQIDTAALTTQVSGELGQWLYLGGSETSEHATGRLSSTDYRSHGSSVDSLYIRVDRLED